MEQQEFDETLGGTENLPYSAKSLKFAASRSIEIAAMTESILRPSKTKLIFQSLPVHMRRRVMSHNCKRLPRKLREGHLEQLIKSGLPPKQKRPSRKYRRRPTNLLKEYNRRQKRANWLETHIWHAKRFHMTDRWGHRLAYAPCDKAFRACYRATSAHCLIQDISYYIPIKISGLLDDIKKLFNTITNGACGLSICAQAYISGKREGIVHLYNPNKFPFGYIGKVHFIWISTDSSINTLWLFIHPSQIKCVENLFNDILPVENNDCETAPKRRKLSDIIYRDKIDIKIMPGAYNRFRLTGPNSHAVLTRSLKCVDNVDKIKSNEWVETYLKGNMQLYLEEKSNYWRSLCAVGSPAQLPPSIAIGLIIKDPRLSRPSIRTKAKHDINYPLDVHSLITIPPTASDSPLWDINIHDIIKRNRFTNSQFIDHITRTQLVPGEVNENDPKLQSVPIILIQRPGSQNSKFKKLGYGCGWDIIVPSGYSLPFWLTFIMFGARAGGLRETENVTFEMGDCYLPPDSEAGYNEELRIKLELQDKYFRLPPSKRVNYVKLAVNSPFICLWKILLNDWSKTPVINFFVLREKKILTFLKDCVNSKKDIPMVENASSCLVAIYLQVIGKGNLKRHAHICLPKHGDLTGIKTLLEPVHNDPNEKLRKEKRVAHLKNIKRQRRKRMKLKKTNQKIMCPKRKRVKHEPSEYVKSMRELWLPSNITSVRHTCSREIMGYLSHGAFSFSEAKTCGVGYIAYNALSTMIQNRQNQVLVRNTSSRKYTLASIEVITV